MITKSRIVLLLGAGVAVGLSLGLAGGVLAEADKPAAPRMICHGRTPARWPMCWSG